MYVAMREQGLTNVQIADELGVSEAAVRRGLVKAGFKPWLVPTKTVQRMAVKLEPAMRFDVKKLGGVAVTADWHHPLTDYQLINTFIDHAREIEATKLLVVAGDWFNMDALSAFDYKQTEAALPRELEGSSETMDRLLDTFETVALSWGNHDARVHKSLGYKLPFADTMRLMFPDLDRSKLSRMRFSNLDHVWLDTPNGSVYVAHPKAYSQQPLSTARKLATIHHAHVLTGHSHHTAIGHDPSGRYVCGELGGFFDIAKTEYLRRTTTYPKWQQGYAFVGESGHIYIEGEGWSTRVGRRL